MVRRNVFFSNTDDDFPVSVNPNPTHDFVVINTAEGNSINIVDSQKSLVYSTTVTAIDTKINLLSFDSGIYSLIITNASGVQVVKILKI
jgi:hypothetical protein